MRHVRSLFLRKYTHLQADGVFFALEFKSIKFFWILSCDRLPYLTRCRFFVFLVRLSIETSGSLHIFGQMSAFAHCSLLFDAFSVLFLCAQFAFWFRIAALFAKTAALALATFARRRFGAAFSFLAGAFRSALGRRSRPIIWRYFDFASGLFDRNAHALRLRSTRLVVALNRDKRLSHQHETLMKYA